MQNIRESEPPELGKEEKKAKIEGDVGKCQYD